MPGQPAPIKISLWMHGKTVLYSTGIKVSPGQWDEKTCNIKKHLQRQYLNLVLSKQKNEWDLALLQLTESGDAKRTKQNQDAADGKVSVSSSAITVDGVAQSIAVFNAAGALQLSCKNASRADISALQGGVYVAIVTVDGKSVAVKFTK